MDAATKERLVAKATALGVSLAPDAVAALGGYVDLLLTWNRKINLTAVTDPAEIVDRHLLDCLAIVPLLGDARTVVDVGSGAGLPGAILAIARPALEVTAVESIRKKVAFLQTVAQQLAPSFHPECARHAHLVLQGRRFDLAVSRATWEPAEWLREGSGLVAPGGRILAMTTAEPSHTYQIGPWRRRIHAARRTA
jgi:16S rRNA (guanine527-N7)-methyltransferase